MDTPNAIELEDPGLRRRTQVAKENSLTTVIWNPWVQKAYSMSDLGNDDWMRMICIETSNVAEFAVELGQGERHTMKATISVGDL
jgi:D-hexose-6-phosphate mutarotase